MPALLISVADALPPAAAIAFRCHATLLLALSAGQFHCYADAIDAATAAITPH